MWGQDNGENERGRIAKDYRREKESKNRRRLRKGYKVKKEQMRGCAER
jgi:hypothetical protein